MAENTSSENNAGAKKPRRLNGLVLLGVVALGLAAIYYRPAVSAVYCTEQTLTPKPDVIMLGAWWCTYCYQARRYFQNNEISYCEYDVERSDEGKRIYQDINGKGVPVILIGKQRLNGFDEDIIDRMLSELHSS